ncbi:hypothetical protein [Alysiella sp.]|nr:hypothetical protein [Alysiella sp.]
MCDDEATELRGARIIAKKTTYDYKDASTMHNNRLPETECFFQAA